jgi:PAS domain-containing protein
MNLVLILARDLADKLASAAFLVDERGTLVYYNERAEQILGQPYAEAGSMSLDEWTASFESYDVEGRRLPVDQLPLVTALRTQEPAHKKLRVKGKDDETRSIAATALPLFAHADEFVGAMAMFWEHSDEDGDAE